MLREVGCRLPAQSALARTATAAPGAQAPRAGSTIRAYARAATYVPARPRHWRSSPIHASARAATYAPDRPRHRRSSTIRALARTATAPVPPIRCLVSAQSARMRAQQPTCQLGLVIGVQAQSTRLHARQPHRSRQSAAWHQHNPRVCTRDNVGLRRFRHHGCSTIHALAHTATAPVPPICCLASARMRAQQRGQLVDSASGDAVRPAHLHARQQPSTATPTRLVHEDALCFLARLEKRIFSLGAGDKHGRDSQAD